MSKILNEKGGHKVNMKKVRNKRGALGFDNNIEYLYKEKNV